MSENIDLEKRWLSSIENAFLRKGIAGEDFFYLLQTMVVEGNITFLDLLCNASQGYGCVIHEGLSYSLDQDWDNPNLFNGVSIFVGEIESSVLPVDDYLNLMRIAADEYVVINFDAGEIVLKYINEIVARYKK